MRIICCPVSAPRLVRALAPCGQVPALAAKALLRQGVVGYDMSGESGH